MGKETLGTQTDNKVLSKRACHTEANPHKRPHYSHRINHNNISISIRNNKLAENGDAVVLPDQSSCDSESVLWHYLGIIFTLS